MTLQLTGTWPWWTLLLPAVLLIAFTIWVYRRTDPPKPWHILLPALRVLALLCLLFSLLRPVLARISEQAERGRVALIIDDSASMGVKDQYEGDEAVKLTWDLSWFPREQRLALFEDPPDALHAVKPSLRRSAERFREIELAEGNRDRRRALRNFEREVTQAAEAVEKLRKDVADAVDARTYLDTEGGGSTDLQNGILWRRYDGIRGDALSDLYAAGSYPDQPDHEGIRDEFSIPSNAGDFYGSVLRAFYSPAESGEYRFMLTSDDAGALYWENPESGNMERIVHSAQWRRTDDWLRAPETVTLEAGQLYLFEARHKEHEGGDHLMIGWERPDGTRERPIPGHYFTPEPPSRGHDDWRAAYYAWREATDNFLRDLKPLSEWDSESGDAGELRALLESLPERWESLAGVFSDLQVPADRALAAMPTEDVREALSRLEKTSRWDLLLEVLTQGPVSFLDALAGKGELRLFFMEEEEMEALDPEVLGEWTPERGSTRLGSVMQRVLQHLEDEPLTALGVISDGQLNAGRPLSSARELAEERDLPLFALGIGSLHPPKDIAILSVNAPETAFQEDRIQLRAVLGRHGFENRPIPLTVRRGDRIMHEEIIPPGSSSRVTVDLFFEEDEDGFHHYILETPGLEGEILEENNRHSFHIRVLEDRIRTLLVDESPRWETRYLRMMLQRDQRVDVHTIFISSLEDGILLRGSGGWPETREDLFGYQTLILGDVDPDHFTEEELNDLHDFVVERGGTLILLSGEHHLPLRYVDRAPYRVFPVERDPTVPPPPVPETGAGSINRALRLTPAGRVDALTAISGDPDLNPRLWENLPGMNRIEPGLRALPASDVLVETADTGEPVLVRGFAGNGRVLFSGTDSFWRWRDRTRWHYHHRLWSQIILWSAVGRTTGDDPNIKLMTDRLRYGRDESVLVNLRLLDDDARPLAGAQGVVEVYDEREEHLRDVPLLPADAGPGEYRAEIPGLPNGRFILRPRVFELGEREMPTEVTVEIGDAAAGELIHLTQDRPRLESHFDHVAPFHDPLSVLDEIKEVQRTREVRVEYEQLFHALLLLVAAMALGAEWHFRKRCKLP